MESTLLMTYFNPAQIQSNVPPCWVFFIFATAVAEIWPLETNTNTHIQKNMYSSALAANTMIISHAVLYSYEWWQLQNVSENWPMLAPWFNTTWDKISGRWNLIQHLFRPDHLKIMNPTALVLQRTSHNLDNKPAFQVDTNSSDSDLEIGQLWLELALDTMHLFEDTRQGLQLTSPRVNLDTIDTFPITLDLEWMNIFALCIYTLLQVCTFQKCKVCIKHIKIRITGFLHPLTDIWHLVLAIRCKSIFFPFHRKLMPVIAGQLDISAPNWYLCRCEIVFVQKWVNICDFEGLVFVWELYCLLITNCLLRIDGMSNLGLKPSLKISAFSPVKVIDIFAFYNVFS